jgi:hypothetical protein
VIQRATEREAEDRYATVAELRQAFSAASHNVAGAGAVAELLHTLLPSELERVREADALSARIAAKTEEARKTSERPPPPVVRRGAIRPLGPDVVVPTGRMSDPRTRTFLWFAVALAAVVGIYQLAMRDRLTEEAHYIMQAVRPPQPTGMPLPSAAPSASASAPQLRWRGPLATASATAEGDDPYADVDAQLAAPSAAARTGAAPFVSAGVTPPLPDPPPTP